MLVSLALAILAATVLLLVIVNRSDNSLQRIRDKGALRVVTANNANTFYHYRGNRMGFEYDLAKAFADRIGVDLEIITPGWNRMLETLETGEADIVAAGVTITETRKERVNFSDCYLSVQQQIITHKSNTSINTLNDLNGKTIHIRSRTSYQERLNELQGDGLSIRIILHQNVPTEEFIRQVAEEEIELTVADSNIALLNRRYYPDIRIAFPIEESQCLGWAVQPGDRALLQEINQFFEDIEANGSYGKIFERYYANMEIFDYVDLKKFHRRLQTRLPKYESIIKREAQKHRFDWRKIAAMIYQESHFNPWAKSYTGVRGLMQVTLTTAKEMNIKNRLDPEQSVKAGVQYLSRLHERFDDIKNPDDRFIFALASYNIGYGHVRDAQDICLEKGWDPQKWSGLSKALPLLRVPEYYKNTTYGYARGTEAVRYVKRILLYYDVIKREALLNGV